MIRADLHYDVDIDQHLVALSELISKETGKPLHFTHHPVTRPCIVSKGPLTQPPETKDHFHPAVISLVAPTPDELLKARSHKPANARTHFDFQTVAQVLDAPYFPPAWDFVTDMFYVRPDARLDRADPQFKEKLQQVLTNLQSQVGGTWTIEDRTLEVWTPETQ